MTPQTRLLRLVAWNLGHQTNERLIRPGFFEALAAMTPDLLVLNEYVHGPTRLPFEDSLRSLGLEHIAVSERIGRNNQVLIASRYRIEQGDLVGPATSDDGGSTNFLHVHLSELDLDVVGIRAPLYKSKTDLTAYWTGLGALVRAVSDRRIMFLGDLNADPDNTRSVGGRTLAALRLEHWQLPQPSGEWSFYRGSRIDHVLASAQLLMPKAAYLTTIVGVDLASANYGTRVSDHAALVVDTEI